MVFSTTTFLFFFFGVVLILYYNPFIKSRGFRNVVLLLASLFFYAWGEPVFVFIMLLSILVNWGMALLIDKRESKKQKKTLLVITVIYNVTIFFVFKYLNFVLENLSYLNIGKGPIFDIALPIGISFFTFQILSYVFDVYYKKAAVQKNILNVALYISFFPQLIAGPIVRFEDITEEIISRKESVEDIAAGMKRFTYGLAKKIFLADYMGVIADNVWATDERSVALAWLGALAYTLQIYLDFSGYSDMAIGLGRVFGFHFLENFNYPYVAASVKDFWGRWHMSLSHWFRDYVYIPLGGNRNGKWQTYKNMLVVWLLTGIWHGANWTFILWGLIYYVLLVCEREWDYATKNKVLGHVYTKLAVILLWVLFRSESVTEAGTFIAQMFGLGAVGIVGETCAALWENSWIVFLMAAIGCLPVGKLVKEKIPKRHRTWMECTWCLILLILALAICAKSTYSPFLYFNF